MKIRGFFSLLVGVLLAVILGMATGASAQESPVQIDPYLNNGGEVNMTAGQEVHIFYGWAALNPGLVGVYLDAAHESFTLAGNGETISVPETETGQYWSPILELPAIAAGLECPRPLVAGSAFDYNLGQLDAGTYTLTFNSRLAHPVNDGLHICTVAGQQVFETPNLAEAGTSVWTVTLNVAPAS